MSLSVSKFLGTYFNKLQTLQFSFQKQSKGEKNQKCIVSNIHLNATLPICHGYYSHVVVTGFWGWFVVGALLGRRWSGRRRVRRQFWCSACVENRWTVCGLVGGFSFLGFVYVFFHADFCFIFYFLICTKDGIFFLRIKKKKKVDGRGFSISSISIYICICICI